MKKPTKSRVRKSATPREYDFSGGVRGKYAARAEAAATLVSLDADVAKLFPDAESVNHALRQYHKLTARSGK